MILGDGDLIAFRHLAADLTAGSLPADPADLRAAVRRFARNHVLDVLGRVRFNKRDAARMLGISLASLYRKLNVEPPDGTVDDEE
jgi:DNA-binding NtrC family response regulator